MKGLWKRMNPKIREFLEDCAYTFLLVLVVLTLYGLVFSVMAF